MNTGNQIVKPFERNRELSVLDDALGRAREGHGSIVLLEGIAGAGKSTLVDYFIKNCEQNPEILSVKVELEAEKSPQSHSYFPFHRLFEDLFGRRRRKQLTDLVPAVIEITAEIAAIFLSGLAKVLPSLCKMLGKCFGIDLAEAARSSSFPTDPRMAQEEKFQRFWEKMKLVSDKQGCVLFVIDNFHLIDDSSSEVLLRLTQKNAIDKIRMLVVCTYRPAELKERKDLSKTMFDGILTEVNKVTGRVVSLSLNVLTKQGVGSIIKKRFGGGDFHDELATVMFSQTKGNPLFVNALLSYMEEKGLIAGKEGILQKLKEIEYDRLPPELKDVISLRIRHISERDPKDYRLLKYASVIGQDFNTPLLSSIKPNEVDDVHNRLRSAATKYYTVRQIAGTLFSFIHVFYRERFYQHAVDEEGDPPVSKIHSKVAIALQEQYGKHLEIGQVLELAYHHEKAGNNKEALRFLREAAKNDREMNGYYELAGLLEKMLELLRGTPHTSQHEEFDVLLELGKTHEILGNKSKAVKKLQKARDVAQEAHHEVSEALARTHLGVSLLHSGEYDESLNELRKACEIFSSSKHCGNLSISELVTYGTCLDYIGENFRELGHFKDAIKFHNSAIELAGESNDTRLRAVVAHANAQLGAIYLRQAKYKRTVQHWTQSFEISEKIGDDPWVAHYGIDLGFIHLLLRQKKQAMERLNAGIERAVKGYFNDNIARGLMNRASVHFTNGEFLLAEEDYQHALPLAEENDVVRMVWRIEHNLGNVRRALGDKEGTIVHYRKSIDMLERLTDNYVEEKDKLGYISHRLRPFKTLIMLAFRDDWKNDVGEFSASMVNWMMMHKELSEFSDRASKGLDLEYEESLDRNFFIVANDGYFVETE